MRLGSWQARSVPPATVPTLAKPVGQFSAGPAAGGGEVGGGVVGGVVGGGVVGGGAGGKAPSPGETTLSAPPPQALRASAAPKVISRVLVLLRTGISSISGRWTGGPGEQKSVKKAV